MDSCGRCESGFNGARSRVNCYSLYMGCYRRRMGSYSRRVESYSLYVGCYRGLVGYYILYVGCYIMHACCADAMWAFTGEEREQIKVTKTLCSVEAITPSQILRAHVPR